MIKTKTQNDNERRQSLRRISILASATSEQRTNQDRRKEDRRGFHHNLDIQDNQFLSEVFTWLLTCTNGEWNAGANENEPNDSPTSCRIRFEDEEDLKSFIVWLDQR